MCIFNNNLNVDNKTLKHKIEKASDIIYIKAINLTMGHMIPVHIF